MFIDTAWWNPADIIAMFSLCPPANVVWASDSPYGLPLVAACQTMRCAFQAGLSAEQLRGVMGTQIERMLDGEDPLDLGPPPGPKQRALDPLLDRVVSHLTTTMGRAFARVDFSEPLALSRLACAVGDDSHVAPNCGAVLELLDDFDEHLAPPEEGRPIPAAGRLLVFALIVARTPDVPLPGPPRRAAPDARRGRGARAELAVLAAADLGRRGRGARRGALLRLRCLRLRPLACGRAAAAAVAALRRARPGRRASSRSRARWCGRR